MRAFGEVAILIAVFFAGIFLAWPRGDFPLDDDQYYGLPAINLAHTGHLELSIAAAPNARAQVIAGSWFVKMFGASFESLRLLTLLLAALSIALVNRTLAVAGVTKFARVAGSMALAFHPIFFWSSCTFMTEVPYVFASALSLYLFARGLRDDRFALMLLGGAAVALSWWVRQTGVLNALPPIALLAIYRARITPRWRTHLALSALPIAVFAIIHFVRRDLLLASPSEFASLTHMWSEATFRLPEQIALVRHYVVFTLQNTALFTIGLVIPTAILLSRKPTRWDAIVLSIAAVVIMGTVYELVHHDSPLPFYSKRVCCDLLYGNIFMNFGLGPPTLTDVWSTNYEYPFPISDGARIFLTWLAGIGALVMFWAVLDAWRKRRGDPRANVVMLIAIASIVISIAGLCVSAVWMDRYVLDAAWPMVIVLALIIPLHANARVAAIVALTILALFTVSATQEYFSWNRARWASYYDLRRAGVPLTQIDGGAEPYNAFEVAFVKDWKIKRKMSFGPGKRHYVIAFHEMPGFRTIARRPFTGWFGLHHGEIVTLERMQ